MSVSPLVPELPSIDPFDSLNSLDSLERPGSVKRPNSDNEAEHNHPNRSFFVTWLLSLLLGFLGADRLYTGRFLTGGLKLVSLGGLGLWWVFDLVIVMAGGLRYDNRPLSGYDSWKEVAWIATGFLLIIGYSLQLDELVQALLIRVF
ncbi:TM2 domain-containing protein [Brevibacterium aurantiacum]|uniref:PPE-repeat protein n=1 Tax=Brevibacterium aurantiacum TaxID=273384 RepID=A0A2H1HNH8_BREAU|nr:TM2 domain-containing protein [Brevibacterium aurantiacum]AOP55304.1 PPE-repeat protein [Brevibacterium aurantiacum]MDN5660608.1 TM2 domain-containing protein [Brevibacterium aurantiacum]SMX64431.1 TM2 domain-containing protein [Brevibacterium aurantiacum]SMX78917.1 TM2 domain-containing protein [Brevibacterium aurantiacum]SMX96244.1 TM2 domain-containing protein [Brevibacterium aurantiacum]